MSKEYILKLSCPDKLGIVAAVTVFLSKHNCNIKDSAQFWDQETGLFFMRVHFWAQEGAPGQVELERSFEEIAQTFTMRWGIHSLEIKSRVAILVSQHGHCLNDLLYRYRTGTLDVEIAAIISNHLDFKDITEWHGIPFHYLPVTKENKAGQEKAIMNIVTGAGVDLIILARYMQILSESLCRELEGRCINIHHSFLPSFKGAQPYKQAYTRGVKLIGATAHYVTGQLDEGPIIEQEVARVDHAHTPDDLVAIGRDVENIVLARAVRYHIEHRVLLNGHKTVILR